MAASLATAGLAAVPQAAHAAAKPWMNAAQTPAQRAQENASRDNTARPRFAWFPFGAGTRQCIGEGFAWMEGVLALATILRDWRVSLPAGSSGALEVLPRITLRPKAGVTLELHRRA